MSCPCDIRPFPPAQSIRAGLGWVPSQFATFPEFRAAMLAEIPAKAAFQQWRAREPGDFGLMILDWWAWLADNLSFYDEVHANESFLRTAQQRASLRKLVGLLGYRPRPSIAAIVELALLLDGRKPVLIPSGTMFRSGSFPGGAPQAFESRRDFTFDPRSNRWAIDRVRRATLDPPDATASSRTFLLADPKTLKLREGDGVLLFHGSSKNARTVAKISDSQEIDGNTYKRIEWNAPLDWDGSTPLAGIQVLRPRKTARLLPPPSSYAWTGGGWSDFVLDGAYGGLTADDLMLMEYKGEYRWLPVYQNELITYSISSSVTTEVKDGGGTVISSVTTPGATKSVAEVWSDHSWNGPAGLSATGVAWPTFFDTDAITIHYSFEKVADFTVPFNTVVEPGDPLQLTRPFELPPELPSLFHIEDADGGGERVQGEIQASAGTLVPQAGSGLTVEHPAPLNAYGNIIEVVRGETVASETLGAGDAGIFRQSFTLKKKPLTYETAPSGSVSSLSVRVAGILWTEVPTLYAVDPDDEVYIVRQDDAETATVTFNRRLPTGAAVTASYRWGAGAVSPPAGSIQQLARPVAGLRSARSVIAPWGGADVEPASQIRKYAPRSALLLGRAISLADMEAAAAAIPGVRAVKADWRWNADAQRPLVHIDYIGPSALADSIRASLRQLSDGETPVEASPATPVVFNLAIGVVCDPRYIPEDVGAAVLSALTDVETGMLAPENVGIGEPLIRSRLFASVLAVPGVVDIDSLIHDEQIWFYWGAWPGSGMYYDFEQAPPVITAQAGT